MTGSLPTDEVVGHDLAGFVRARGPALVRFAHGLCGDRALAEDLVQEALVRLVRRFGARLEAVSPDAYVRRVVVRELLQHRRRRSSGEVPAPVPDLAADPADRPEPDERAAVWAVLGTLPAEQRAVLVLGYYEGLGDDEIAALMGCTRVTVRSRRKRALDRLREHPVLVGLDEGPGGRR